MTTATLTAPQAVRIAEFVPPPPIVVGVDGSATSLDAVRWAAREAERTGAALRLTHACDLPPLESEVPEDTEAASWAGSGRCWLVTAASVAAAEAPGVETDWSVRIGDATAVLTAQSREAGLVVLGSKGLDGRRRPGSVASAVAGSAACPVVVVRDGTVGADTGLVVAGTDGSPAACDALAFAFEAAAVRNARLVVVRAWCGPWAAEAGDDLGPAGLTAARECENRRLSADLTGWREKFPRVRVSMFVASGDRPAPALLAAAANAQLLVVGRHGRGGAPALGSASGELLRDAGCPVAVVRPPQ
ncbi:universal stress protein [Prauserella cavernicola]|uniref:Universal stress protein n=1 Tax=Prauserella cavernicola TaxID=2800127 RepID=A0A934QNJ0_9PSEU|nr:universal stress protein [Prauserella cavernicola]MBK1782824.1 universal stress protein [Prauserella cavernicola]